MFPLKDCKCEICEQIRREEKRARCDAALWGLLNVLLAIALVFLVAGVAKADEPTASLQLRSRVVDVYDGDTITVEFKLQARVRLLDCWAPEVRTRDNDEKIKGLAARDYLKSIAEGRDGVLVIPLDGANRLDDLFTFGRLLGHYYIKDDEKSLAKRMREAGHATREKPE